MSVRGKIFVDLSFGDYEPRILKTYSFGNFVVSGEGKMPISIPAGKGTVVNIQPIDKYGNPTKFDGEPEWISSSPEAFTVTAVALPAEVLGYSAEIRSKGPMTTGQWSVSGDADLGEGTRSLTHVDDVTIVAGDADKITASYGPIID